MKNNVKEVEITDIEPNYLKTKYGNTKRVFKFKCLDKTKHKSSLEKVSN